MNFGIGMLAVALLLAGAGGTAQARSWNSSHPSRGCGLEALRMSGGAGLLYCFAID